MIALLLQKYWGVALAVVCAGWLMVACHQRDQAIEQRGRAIERVMQLDRQLASLTAKHRADSTRADSLASVVAVDTVALTRWLTRYDTARVRFDVHDTIEVIRYAATADSTIRSCRQTVLDLLSSCEAKDTVIADLRAVNAILRSAQPIPPKPERRLHAGVGYSVILDRSTRRMADGPSLSIQWSFF